MLKSPRGCGWAGTSAEITLSYLLPLSCPVSTTPFLVSPGSSSLMNQLHSKSLAQGLLLEKTDLKMFSFTHKIVKER